MSGIYIHIPFCSSFCIYCDFYSITDCSKGDRYISALEKEIIRRKNYIRESPKTIYIGGGTPSLLSVSQLDRLVSSLHRNFSFQELEEFTVEVNPDDISRDYVDALKSLGVNRVSMGVQSFDDRNLKWMRRRHTSQDAYRAYKVLRDGGIENISMDLIFGYTADGISPQEALNIWIRDVMSMMELRPEHISAYQMSIEPGSLLALKKDYQEPPQELCEEEYYKMLDLLEGGGYSQYEISNFSLPGFHSKHNSSYWERTPYLGLGAAAHSFDGSSRSWNPDDIEKYIKEVDNGFGEDFIEHLSPVEALEEKIMLGLRKREGIVFSDEEYLQLLPRIEKLAKQGYLIHNPGSKHIVLPRSMQFISDSIISKLI